MYVRFWGTRGSIAAPGEHTARYGGNTSCVELRAADGSIIVLDCGTGARELGIHLVRTEPHPLRLHLLIGHTHWDHIQGFPFFVPAFLPGCELNVYAPLGFQRSLEESMSGQMEYSYFPVKLRDLRSRIHFTELEEGFFRIGEVLVETQYLNHTAPTIGYRLASDGATVAYITDHEPFWASSEGVFHHPGDERHIEFMRGADLVIHDAQYSHEEYGNRVGWGHSTVEYAVDAARVAGARRLALFHHDPSHDDAAMDRLVAMAKARAGGDVEVFAAQEGLGLTVEGGGAEPRSSDISALRRRMVAGARVLVVSPDEQQATLIDETLAEDGMVSLGVPDMRAALTRGSEHMPDLLIIDAHAPPSQAMDQVKAFRSRMGRPNFPVILLADKPDAAALRSSETWATDLITRPYSPPMLRARVRAWLARTLIAGNTLADALEARRESFDGTPEATADQQTMLTTMLTELPLFRDLSPDLVQVLVSHASERVFPAGHVIIKQGDAPEHLYVMLSGRVRVVEATVDGQAEMLLGEVGRAEIFGELGILRDQPRSATVVAIDRTHCVAVRQRDFVKVLDQSTSLANGLLRVLAARLYDAARRLARYAPDPLTGVASRRAFHDQYRRLAAAARRRNGGLLLLALDVLNLKSINDGFGYGLGDEVLRTVADALTEATRTTDVVARYGGDEFAVLLLDAVPKDVDLVIARVRHKLGALALARHLPVMVEYSTGVAWSQSPPETADEFLQEADHDMHERKSARARRDAV